MLAAPAAVGRTCRSIAAMPYLIDASNLGGLLGGRAGARDAAATLRFLLPWARRRAAPVVVVFDGPPRAGIAAPHPRTDHSPGARGEKPPPSAAEVHHWRRAFGLEAAEDETAPAQRAGATEEVELAPGEGFEPPTNRLTAGRSTTELPRKGGAGRRDRRS